MFALCVTCNLASMCLDFIQGFPQADMKKDVFIEMPFGYDNPNGDCMLKLKKNFYGLCDGNLTCNEHLKCSLLKRGFTASHTDPCFFCKQGVIVVVYVDDCCAFGTYAELIESFVMWFR